MSNDLISRNEVMKLIESKFVDDCLEEGDKTLIDGYGLLDDVSDIPAAYEVDKVVEQLEEKILNTSDTQIGISARMALGKAIEIVKSGGISKE